MKRKTLGTTNRRSSAIELGTRGVCQPQRGGMFIADEQKEISSSFRSNMKIGHAAPMGLVVLSQRLTINMPLLTELALREIRNAHNSVAVSRATDDAVHSLCSTC